MKFAPKKGGSSDPLDPPPFPTPLEEVLISGPFSHPTTAYLHPLTKTDQTAAQNENQWRTTGRAGQEAVQVVSSGARPSFICGWQCLPPTRGHYRPVLGDGRPARDPAPTGTMCAVCRDPRAGWVGPYLTCCPLEEGSQITWRRPLLSPLRFTPLRPL